MLVRDCVFVTKCFTYKDQGPSSHTQTLHMCVGGWTICSELQLRPKGRMTNTQTHTQRKTHKFLMLLHQIFKKPSRPKLQLLVLPQTTGLPQCCLICVKGLQHFDGRVRDRSFPAVLRSSEGGESDLCLETKVRGQGGHSITYLMQHMHACVCICVCVCGGKGSMLLCEAGRRLWVGAFSLHKKKKPLITHLNLRIVQKPPRRADLSPPVGTYLSPSFFLCLPLKAGCFNLTALTRDRLEFHLLPKSHEDMLSLLRLRKT